MFLDGQAIDGDMFRPEPECLVKFVSPLFKLLPRQRVYQVDADGGEAGTACFTKSLFGLCCGMDASQLLQEMVIKGLDAEG